MEKPLENVIVIPAVFTYVNDFERFLKRFKKTQEVLVMKRS
jgi:hypothetical protein